MFNAFLKPESREILKRFGYTQKNFILTIPDIKTASQKKAISRDLEAVLSDVYKSIEHMDEETKKHKMKVLEKMELNPNLKPQLLTDEPKQMLAGLKWMLEDKIKILKK